jgi:lipopolysaccharide export system permease protein
MRTPRILWRYILTEVVTYAAIGFVAVAAILVSQNLLRRLDELAAVGFSPVDSLAVLACIFPMLASYTVPVAFLFGILVAFGRLSADSEITAMRACGLSLTGLLGPALLLGVGVSALTAYLVVELEPASRRELRSVLNDIASRGAVVEPGRFNALDKTGRRLLLVQAQNDESGLEGVMIVDRADPARPYNVFAERGRFVFDEEKAEIHLILENGSMHFEAGGSEEERYRQLSFAHLDYGIDASGLVENEAHMRPREMALPRLLKILDHFEEHGRAPEGLRYIKLVDYEVQLHRRAALPLAPIWFALIGVPLGIRRTRGARSYGVLVCVGLVFSYYTLLSFGVFLADKGHMPVGPALWIPNLAFAAVAACLLRRLRYTEI